MTSTTVAMTGNQNIDGILSGVRWDGVFTYGFPTVASEYGSYSWLLDHDNNPATPAITVDETTGFSALNTMQQAAAEAAFAEFRALTTTSALRQEPGGSADIRIAMSTSRDPNNTTAYAKYPGNGARDGDAWFNTTSYNAPRLGTFAYQTFFHEIGHAMGLKHGHEFDNGNNTVIPSNRDSLEFTTMTYRSYEGAPTTGGYTVADGNYPQTFMMLDIAALQYMYGADFSTNSGATNYRFDPVTGEMFVNNVSQGVPQNNAGGNTNVLFRTIWDGGGIDTYDFSSYGANRQLLIDLAPGGWSDVDSDSSFQAARLGTSGGSAVFARGQVFNALLFNGDARSLIENVIGGAGDDWIKGNQANNALYGNDGHDILEGFDGNDTLDAGTTAGGSEMYGGNGIDRMWAGPGADYIDGGNDTDMVDYSRSTGSIQIDTTIGKVVGGWATGDTLVSVEDVVGSAFDDVIALGDEKNWVDGGNGWDQIDGRGGDDVILGGEGNDTLRGGAGGDFLIGGNGWDIAAFGSASTINLATGVHGGEAAGDTYSGIEQFNGSAEADTMVAANGTAAYFVGGDGADSLYGADMNDWLQGGKGGDYINGGNGSDTVSYADAPNGIIAELYFNDGTTDGKITAGDWGLDTLVSIENIEGTNYGDVLYGDERANTLIGLGGDDNIKGDAGSDNPPASNDTLYGGSGNDTLDGGGGADYMDGGTGDDVFYVDTNLDAVREAAGQGYDTVIASASFNLHATLAEVEVLMTSNTAGTTAINLRGSNSDNTLIGNYGINVLDGYGGNDTLVVTPDSVHDDIIGGDGFDTLVFIIPTVADWQAGVLDSYVGIDSFFSWEAIQGSDGNDRIRTNSWGFAVTLRGGSGNDVLATGVTGVMSDKLYGDDGDDELNGGAGNDRLDGGRDDDTLFGSDGNDRLFGGNGGDKLNGGSGRDVLNAGRDTDVLIGGRGRDTFDFNDVTESGTGAARDIIRDFTVDLSADTAFSDRIDVSSVDADEATAGNQAFTFIGGAAFSAAGQIRAVQSGDDTIIQLNTSGNSVSEMQILLWKFDVSMISGADFIL